MGHPTILCMDGTGSRGSVDPQTSGSVD